MLQSDDHYAEYHQLEPYQQEPDDNCKRNPVQTSKIPYYISEALLVLKKTNKISSFEFFITYSYLFNGISLKMLKDRILRKTKSGYIFTSKQHIHQNIISKVIELMKKEINKIREAERLSESRENISKYEQV